MYLIIESTHKTIWIETIFTYMEKWNQLEILKFDENMKIGNWFDPYVFVLDGEFQSSIF